MWLLCKPKSGLKYMLLNFRLAGSEMGNYRRGRWRAEGQEKWPVVRKLEGRALLLHIFKKQHLLTYPHKIHHVQMSKQAIDFSAKNYFSAVLWSVITNYEFWIYTEPGLASCLNTICSTSVHSCHCNQSVPREKLTSPCKCLKILWLVPREKWWPSNDLNPCLGVSKEYLTSSNLVFLNWMTFFWWYFNKQYN